MPSKPIRAAALDIGTNSALLTIAEQQEGGPPKILLERATITRLGEGVDQTRELSPSAIFRTLACLKDYAAEIERFGATALDIVGTSALRDTSNGNAFLEPAERLLGKRPRVIDGHEEARLTCVGALGDLPVSGAFTVFDLGGGSTEVIVGRNENGLSTPEHFQSLDIGCVRLTERHVRNDPPSSGEILAIAQDAAGEIASLRFPSCEGPLIGVAGTVTTLAAIHHRLTSYDPSKVHGTRIEIAELRDRRKSLQRLNRDERAMVPGLPRARSDVILAGLVIVEELMSALDRTELLVSDRGVRHGLLLELFR